jgi:endonuclease/exonuclease/phosphatase family metal-dependent hydrolase
VHIRVLTYNIHKAIGTNGRFTPELIAQVVRHHDPDLALLQEVTCDVERCGRLDLAAEIARACDFPFHALAVNVLYKVGGYGNATLSRFPIRKRRNIDLTVGWRKKRGCLYTYHDLPGDRRRRLHVFNVHLGLSRAERALQVQRLLETPLVASIKAEHPTIFGGDFNDWRDSLYPRVMEPAGCAYATRHRRRFGLRTFPSYSPLGALDKVFVRGGFQILHAQTSRLRVTSTASDHLPVIVDLEL